MDHVCLTAPNQHTQIIHPTNAYPATVIASTASAPPTSSVLAAVILPTPIILRPSITWPEVKPYANLDVPSDNTSMPPFLIYAKYAIHYAYLASESAPTVLADCVRADYTSTTIFATPIAPTAPTSTLPICYVWSVKQVV